MANFKISGLTAASAAADANQLEINEAGTSKRVTLAQMRTQLDAGLAGGRTLTGGTAASEVLTLRGTSHATPGTVTVSAGGLTVNAGALTAKQGIFGNDGVATTGQLLLSANIDDDSQWGTPNIFIRGSTYAVSADRGDIIVAPGAAGTSNGEFRVLDALGAARITSNTTGVTLGGRQRLAQGADVASANDITLGNGNYFDVTGTTQINTIAATDWTAGSLVTLQFDASVTVAHATAGTGAQLALAGAANFSATVGDTLSLRYDGTVWREVARAVI